MTIKIANPRILYTGCPLCASSKIRNVLKASCSKHPLYNEAIPDTMTWSICDSCNHIFTEGYFTDAALAVIFSKTNERQQLGHDLENQRLVSARMIDRVLPFKDRGIWMDVGFGNGSLLFTAAEYGFTPVGLDLREANVTALRDAGGEAYCIDMNKLDHDGRYDVISMCDVLEHMPYPAQALEKAHRLLRDDGVIFVSMPNIDSTLWNALDGSKANPYWGELEHYHNFGRKRLYALLNQYGFEPLRFGVSERYRCCMEMVARKVSKTAE
jgi:SAM-dependent methyltransferase